MISQRRFLRCFAFQTHIQNTLWFKNRTPVIFPNDFNK